MALYKSWVAEQRFENELNWSTSWSHLKWTELTDQVIWCEFQLVDQSQLYELRWDCREFSERMMNWNFFFQFIEERLFLSMDKSDVEMELLVHLFQKSLDVIHSNIKRTITREVKAVGLRFWFLHLAFHILQTNYVFTSDSQRTLRAKIYLSAFDYFTSVKNVLIEFLIEFLI